MATSVFTWIPFYEELADILLPYRTQQSSLIEFLKTQRDAGLPVTPLADRDTQGRKSLLTVLDPFTFFGAFNRGQVKDEKKLALLDAIKRTFGVKADLPRDFAGIPTVHPLNSWFFAFAPEREPDAIDRLWDVFHAAVAADPWTGEGLPERRRSPILRAEQCPSPRPHEPCRSFLGNGRLRSPSALCVRLACSEI